jgi:hypothetical protein
VPHFQDAQKKMGEPQLKPNLGSPSNGAGHAEEMAAVSNGQRRDDRLE